MSGTVLKTVFLLCCPFLGLVGACAAGPDADGSAPNRAGGPTDATASRAPGTGGLGGSPSREADILFPRVKQSAGQDAGIVGKLVADGAGCLRLRGGTGDDTVPLWMRGWRLKTGDGGPRVLDDEGRTVGRVGGKVMLGGGEFPKRMLRDVAMADGSTTARELLERCPGDYWLVSGHSGL
jgi:hypothetical protein